MALGFGGVVAVDIDSDQPGSSRRSSPPWAICRLFRRRGAKAAPYSIEPGRPLCRKRSASTASACSTCSARASKPSFRRQSTQTPACHTRGSAARWSMSSPRACRCCPTTLRNASAEALKPFGYEAPVERSQPVGDSDGTWREINDALANLDSGFRVSALAQSARANRGARRRNGATATA